MTTGMILVCLFMSGPMGSSGAPGGAWQSAIPDVAPEPGLIGTMRGRDFGVRYYTGGLHAVEDAAGEPIATGLDEAQLAEEFPEIHARCRDAVAGEFLADIHRYDASPAILHADAEPR